MKPEKFSREGLLTRLAKHYVAWEHFFIKRRQLRLDKKDMARQARRLDKVRQTSANLLKQSVGDDALTEDLIGSTYKITDLQNVEFQRSPSLLANSQQLVDLVGKQIDHYLAEKTIPINKKHQLSYIRTEQINHLIAMFAGMHNESELLLETLELLAQEIRSRILIAVGEGGTKGEADAAQLTTLLIWLCTESSLVETVGQHSRVAKDSPFIDSIQKILFDTLQVLPFSHLAKYVSQGSTQKTSFSDGNGGNFPACELTALVGFKNNGQWNHIPPAFRAIVTITLRLKSLETNTGETEEQVWQQFSLGLRAWLDKLVSKLSSDEKEISAQTTDIILACAAGLSPRTAIELALIFAQNSAWPKESVDKLNAFLQEEGVNISSEAPFSINTSSSGDWLARMTKDLWKFSRFAKSSGIHDIPLLVARRLAGQGTRAGITINQPGRNGQLADENMNRLLSSIAAGNTNMVYRYVRDEDPSQEYSEAVGSQLVVTTLLLSERAQQIGTCPKQEFEQETPKELPRNKHIDALATLAAGNVTEGTELYNHLLLSLQIILARWPEKYSVEFVRAYLNKLTDSPEMLGKTAVFTILSHASRVQVGSGKDIVTIEHVNEKRVAAIQDKVAKSILGFVESSWSAQAATRDGYVRAIDCFSTDHPPTSKAGVIQQLWINTVEYLAAIGKVNDASLANKLDDQLKIEFSLEVLRLLNNSKEARARRIIETLKARLERELSVLSEIITKISEIKFEKDGQRESAIKVVDDAVTSLNLPGIQACLAAPALVAIAATKNPNIILGDGQSGPGQVAEHAFGQARGIQEMIVDTLRQPLQSLVAASLKNDGVVHREESAINEANSAARLALLNSYDQRLKTSVGVVSSLQHKIHLADDELEQAKMDTRNTASDKLAETHAAITEYLQTHLPTVWPLLNQFNDLPKTEFGIASL